MTIARRATRVIAGLSAAATAAVLLHASQPADGESRRWLGIALFGLWTLLPYATLAWIGTRGGSRWRDAILVAGVTMICSATLAIYYQAFFVDLDAQAGLVFLFLPAYQHAAALAVLLASRFAPGS